MKSIDEFGSVLAMAALVIGACAAVDGVLLPATADGAGPSPAFAAQGAAKFIAVVHRDRVILADHSRTEPAAAGGGATAPVATAQHVRMSW